LVEFARELLVAVGIGTAALIVSTDVSALLAVTLIEWVGSR
jgi:hypothetical protein